jgi:flagellar hook protein FlgE
MSFQQGLSGLDAASKNLDTIGNNVANAATVGFKEGRAEFSDIYANSLATGVGAQIGIGVNVSAVAPQFTQGNVSTTGNPLDVAINGQGFYRMTNNGAISYSRDGEFSLDKNGYLVNSAGAQLTGYPASAAGVVTPTTPQPLQVTTADLAPIATSAAALAVNLNSTATVPSTAFATTDPTSYNSSTAMTVYDGQGNAHTLTTFFVKSSANNWNVYAAADGTLLNGGAKVGALAFGAGGTLAADAVMPLSIPLANGAATPLAFNLTFPAATNSQYGVAFAVNSNTQAGYTTGQLSGYSIGPDGTIQGRYSNGQTRDLGQIALANFINPQGLTALGGNQWAETSVSGQPTVGAPTTGSLGTLQSGAVENSNVDLTTQLVDMITAQRNYQANAQTIKTENTVQQTLVSLQ